MTAGRLELRCAEADELAGLYALGALSDAESRSLNEHLLTCPYGHPLFAEIGAVVPALPLTVDPIEPPRALRERVLAAVAATPQGDLSRPSEAPARPDAVRPVTSRVAAGTQPIDLAAARERRASRFGSAWRTALAAAALLLIVALGATTLVFQRQAADAETRAATLRAALVASLDPNSTTAGLHGSGAAASAAGFAAFPPDGNGYLVVRGLPQVDADKTYQAWFLAGSTPYPSVLLRPGFDGLAVVQGLSMMPGADAVALTIEPASGAQTPSGPPVVVGKMKHGPVAAVTLPTLAGSPAN